jgi:hypothetical protein
MRNKNKKVGLATAAGFFVCGADWRDDLRFLNDDFR